ncbi:elongation factor P maturation arginine rhamnosyltransferase EarP [Piscinibacter sakaiensis]|uniref:elongation factor P maturation arginine rhamnosyltransferase EarP n=1 Tax=Piscinibacter sakaiensis TaxID=1547922 RepID=UPI003AAFE23A
MPWDLFCRVVDNFGDIGVCWRLAAQLGDRGQPVRLWVDDASALEWMAPDRQREQPLVSVFGFDEAASAEPGEVVIEAFGCDPPPDFVARMAQRKQLSGRQPVWINLEYLSAEAHAERNHRLPSPQSAGPGAGLLKYFFFPGFSAGSGGLLREDDLLQQQERFDAEAWLTAQGITLQAYEQPISLFCYPESPVAELIDRLTQPDRPPTLLLATAGAASAMVAQLLGPTLRRGGLRALCLPWLSQTDYDHLLWSCAINFVRGEDSAVRAQWAAKPFVWQLYRQDDGADQIKGAAFLQRFFAPAVAPVDKAMMSQVSNWWTGWNRPPGSGAPLPHDWPDHHRWQAHCIAWRDHLAAQSGLVDRLQAFVAEAS